MTSRPGSRGRAGLSLLEMLVTLVLLGGLLAFAGGALGTLQQHSANGVARQDAAGRAAQVAELLATELRDLSLSRADLEPDAPFACQELRYRLAVGHTGGALVVDPPAASGRFWCVRLVSGRLERVAPDGTVLVLAGGVDDLALTLRPPDRLEIRITIRRRGAGETLFGISELTVLLRNRG